MMTIGTDRINTEMMLKELEIISNLIFERLANMESNLGKADSHKYIRLMQLSGKIDGLMRLIKHKKNSKNEMAKNSHL